MLRPWSSLAEMGAARSEPWRQRLGLSVWLGDCGEVVAGTHSQITLCRNHASQDDTDRELTEHRSPIGILSCGWSSVRLIFRYLDDIHDLDVAVKLPGGRGWQLRTSMTIITTVAGRVAWTDGQRPERRDRGWRHGTNTGGRHRYRRGRLE